MTDNSQKPDATEVPIKTTGSSVVYQNPWITIHEDSTLLPSGKEGIYGYMESKDSVMVAVLNDNQEVYLVRAFRYPSKSWGWEFPGGGGEGEELTVAARREVEEETGIRSRHCEKIGESLVCNGLMTERMTTCVAYDISFDGNQDLADEALTDMRFFSQDEILEMVDSGEINDGQTITGIFYLQRWLHKKGKTA